VKVKTVVVRYLALIFAIDEPRAALTIRPPGLLDEVRTPVTLG
jgi:hypothetical protein